MARQSLRTSRLALALLLGCCRAMAGAHRVGGAAGLGTVPRRHLLLSPPPSPAPAQASPPPPPRSPPPAPPPSVWSAYLPYRNGSVNLAYQKSMKWSSINTKSFVNSSFWLTSMGLYGVPDSSKLVPFPPVSTSACPVNTGQTGHFVSNYTNPYFDRTPWFEVDLGAAVSIGVVEVWYGNNIGNMTATGVGGCGINVYVSATSALGGGYGTQYGLDLYSQVRGYHNCTAEALPRASTTATIVSCNLTGRFVTVQLATPPGTTLPGTTPAGRNTCGRLDLCSLQVYGSFLPSPPVDDSLSPALIKSFSIPVGVFLLLLVPFCMWLAFRRSAQKKARLLEHWPIITPKRLVAEEAPPATPPTRGKALMAESRRGEAAEWAPSPSKAMSSLDGMGGGGLGEGYGGGTLAKPPGSPGAEFTNPMFGKGGEGAEGATASAPPARQEAWY